MKGKTKYLLTGIVVLLAVGLVYYKYWDYTKNPWTRDGQVRAQVVQIAPRISGPIIELPIKDNQFVKAGQVLFKIDPRTFKSNLDRANANLAQAKANLAPDVDSLARNMKINKRTPGAIPQKIIVNQTNLVLAAKAEILGNEADVENARLDLEFTTVKAPVDGYVTNLNLRKGSQAVANDPMLALVDVNSYWVDGFFRENYIEDIQIGDQAVITLMSSPDKPIKGRVESVGWGIAQDDGSTSEDLLPSISPTFEWIRLAQRVPVSIKIIELPKGVKLRVGTTASVMVRTGTYDSKSEKKPVAVPRALE
jgi:multidrug resistance efflux pump